MFAYSSYTENETGNKQITNVFIILDILFQPLIKIALGRIPWNVLM